MTRTPSRLALANRMKPQFNCVITNVPGPPVPIYSTGAKMVANYGAGPLMEGLGLFHAIGSYCGDVTISATSCRDMMPDPEFYRQCLQESFDELKVACAALTPAKGNSNKPAKGDSKKPTKKKAPAQSKSTVAKSSAK